MGLRGGRARWALAADVGACSIMQILIRNATVDHSA